tara:strand:+ start:990 stop:1871 length:882 start_codon:yes stop_codon:yes gene_type:complete
LANRDKLNVLVAYPYFKQNIGAYLQEKDPNSFRLIVDSGAFTAWNTGTEITMKGYTEFLKTIPKHWDTKIVQLDVYGNPEATYANWKRMLDMGWSNVMPVFTRGDKLERLDEFYSVTDYIMFGGICVGGENKNYIKFFSEANKGRKVHWLGFVNMPFIKHYKPKSVDSSSITSGQRYGNLSYYKGGGVLSSIHKNDFAKRPPIEFLKSCEARGFTIKELRNLGRAEAWTGGAKVPNSKTLNGFASFINFTHQVWRGIDVERAIGTRIYHAFATVKGLSAAFDAYAFMQKRGSF